MALHLQLTNLSGGERVEIFTDKSRLLYEDGNEVLLNGYQNSQWFNHINRL